MKRGRKLTAKQELFVQEYLKDLNATAAAGRAGYKGNNLDHIGPELLRKTTVQEAIQKAKDKRSAKVELTNEWIIEGLMREVRGEGGDSRSSARVAALSVLAKHKGMLLDRMKLEGGSQLELLENVVRTRKEASANYPGRISSNGEAVPVPGRNGTDQGIHGRPGSGEEPSGGV